MGQIAQRPHETRLSGLLAGAEGTTQCDRTTPHCPRTGHNSQFPLPDLFRQSIYSRLAGYEDTNDAERLAEDPAFRMLASRERGENSMALTSTLHWFETDVLAEERNYQGLARLNTLALVLVHGGYAARIPASDARSGRRQHHAGGHRGAGTGAGR